MRTFLVSDIHGHYFTFLDALSKVRFQPGRDRLIVIGDVVDRGLHSKECLLYIYQLQKKYPHQIHLIKGNHEQLFEDWLTNKVQPDLYFANGGLSTIRSFLDQSPLRRAFVRNAPDLATQEAARNDILSRYPFLLTFLQSLPLYLEEPVQPDMGAPHVIFVHAGIRPGIPLQEQRPTDLLWIRDDFWNHYNGSTTIVFGHTMVRRLPGYRGFGPWSSSKMIGIDGGAASYDGGILLVEWPTLEWVFTSNRDMESIPVVNLLNITAPKKKL